MTERTEEEKRKILKAYVDGLPVRAISERFGCSPTYPIVLAKQAGVPRRGNTKRSKRYWT